MNQNGYTVSTIKCIQMATITYCLNASMFIKGAFSFNITYAKTSTKVPSSGSDSCCWENNRRNSLKETLKFVLSTDTELASSWACSSEKDKRLISSHSFSSIHGIVTFVASLFFNVPIISSVLFLKVAGYFRLYSIVILWLMQTYNPSTRVTSENSQVLYAVANAVSRPLLLKLLMVHVRTFIVGC